MSTIRVLIADDHLILRAGLRTLLEATAGIEVAAEAKSGKEAIALTREHKPDVVVTDIGMPDIDGLQATEAIKQEMPQVKVVVLSMHDSADFVDRALRAGASGYLVKDAVAEELHLAIRAVAGGGTYLSPSISQHVLDRYLQSAGSPARGELLTPRQREILDLIGAGKSTKDIAYQLKLSIKTVETHRAQIMQRLGVRNATNLILEATRRGLISVRK